MLKMPSLLALMTLLFIDPTFAELLVIPNVKVSINDASAAIAREKAIAQGHRIAFQKALQQLGIGEGEAGQVPSDNDIMSMARSFTPDIEKQTATSYAASFTFQFDDQTLRKWVSQSQNQEFDNNAPFLSSEETSAMGSSSHNHPIFMPEKRIHVVVPLHSINDIVTAERLFSQSQNIRGNVLKSLTKHSAEYELRIAGHPQDLNSFLEKHGWKIEEHNSQYTLTPRFQSMS